jgi:hypothetical protein
MSNAYNQDFDQRNGAKHIKDHNSTSHKLNIQDIYFSFP